MSLVAADWVLLGVLALSLGLGFWRGLAQEVLSLAGWVLAWLAAQWWAPWAASHLPLIKGASAGVQYAAGFVGVFVAVAVVCALITVLIRKVLQSVGLGMLDRSLGAMFGLLRGLLVLLIALVLMQLIGLVSQPWWQESLGRPWLEGLLHALSPLLPQNLQDLLP